MALQRRKATKQSQISAPLLTRPTEFNSTIQDWSLPKGLAPNSSDGWENAFSNWYEAEVEKTEVREGDDWDTSVPPKSLEQLKEEEIAVRKEEMDEKLTGWPWMTGPKEPVTIGPFCLNDHTQENVLSMSLQTQINSHLMRVMDVGGVREMIIDLLFQYHSSIWQFAFCCQKAQYIVSITVGVWDLTTLNFNGCEIEPNPNDLGARGTVASNLVVAYLRGPQRVLMEKTLYESQLWATYQLCRAVQWRGHNFTRLHLHRVPFLTIDLIHLLIPQMTKLEVLGIYKCPLIHVGHAMKLLKIIQVDRLKGRECQVTLDFYPRLHVGPVGEAGNEHTVGGFGATWEDWQGPTDRAIWATVFRFAIQCAKQGIDALSPHTQFRKWLDDGPCYDVENTLSAMNVAFGFDKINRGETLLPPFKKKVRRRHHPNGRPIEDNEYFDLYPELTRAVMLIDQRNPYHEGNIKRFFTHNEYKRPEGMEWMYVPYKCTFCYTLMPGVFYQYPDIKLFNEETENGKVLSRHHELPCLGCRLNNDLHRESDHFKQEKYKIMEEWTSDHVTEEGENTVNTTDLGKLMEVFGPRQIMSLAVDLDNFRYHHREIRGYDRETEEQQMPVTRQVIRSKRGAFLSAPKIGEWKREVERRKIIERDPSMKQWLRCDKTRYLVHHRHYG